VAALDVSALKTISQGSQVNWPIILNVNRTKDSVPAVITGLVAARRRIGAWDVSAW